MFRFELVGLLRYSIRSSHSSAFLLDCSVSAQLRVFVSSLDRSLTCHWSSFRSSAPLLCVSTHGVSIARIPLQWHSHWKLCYDTVGPTCGKLVWWSRRFWRKCHFFVRYHFKTFVLSFKMIIWLVMGQPRPRCTRFVTFCILLRTKSIGELTFFNVLHSSFLIHVRVSMTT